MRIISCELGSIPVTNPELIVINAEIPKPEHTLLQQLTLSKSWNEKSPAHVIEPWLLGRIKVHVPL